jgi:hypothetical protein
MLLLSLEIWVEPLEASHYIQPKASISIFYWLFSVHLFKFSTKFGHSIPPPLSLDGHSVKWSLGALHTTTEGREAVDFHQSNCKNPRVRPLALHTKAKVPKAVAI